MVTQKLEQGLRALSFDDQVTAIQILVEAIENKSQGVAKVPGVMGTRIPV